MRTFDTAQALWSHDAGKPQYVAQTAQNHAMHAPNARCPMPAVRFRPAHALLQER